MNRIYRRSLIAILFLIPFGPLSCGQWHGPDSPYALRYQTHAVNVSEPPAQDVLQNGMRAIVPAPPDDVWRAALQVASQCDGILTIDDANQTRQLVVIHGEPVYLKAPGFTGNAGMYFTRFMDSWLSIVVAPGPTSQSSTVAIAWIAPNTFAATKFNSLGATDAGDSGGATAFLTPDGAASALTSERSVTISSLGKKYDDPNIKQEMIPRFTAQDFLYHINAQLFSEQLWLKRFDQPEPQPRGLAPQVQKENVPNFDKLEQAHGDWCSAFIRRNDYVIYCPKITAKLEQIIQRLLIASGNPDRHMRVYVVASRDINAFTLPNGDIFVCAGLLDQLSSRDEVAAVLAHELDHALQHDSVRKLKSDRDGLIVLTSVEIAVAVGTAGYAGAAEGAAASITATTASTITSAVAQIGGEAVTELTFAAGNATHAAILTGYSRNTELRADANGTRYLWGAGYNPYAMIDVMQKLKEIESTSGQQKTFISISHFANCDPGVKKRTENLQKVVKSLPN